MFCRGGIPCNFQESRPASLQALRRRRWRRDGQAQSAGPQPPPRRHRAGGRVRGPRNGQRRRELGRPFQENRGQRAEARSLLPAGREAGREASGGCLHQRRRRPARREAQGLGHLQVLGPARRRLGLDRRQLRGARRLRPVRSRHPRRLRLPPPGRRAPRHRCRPDRRLGLFGQRHLGPRGPHERRRSGRARRGRLLRHVQRRKAPGGSARVFRARGPRQPAPEHRDRRVVEEGHLRRRAVDHGQRADLPARVRRVRRDRREPAHRARDPRLLPRPLHAARADRAALARQEGALPLVRRPRVPAGRAGLRRVREVEPERRRGLDAPGPLPGEHEGPGGGGKPRERPCSSARRRRPTSTTSPAVSR